MRDLAAMRAIDLELEDQRYLLRADVRGSANVAFRAVNLRPPPFPQPLEGATDA